VQNEIRSLDLAKSLITRKQFGTLNLYQPIKTPSGKHLFLEQKLTMNAKSLSYKSLFKSHFLQLYLFSSEIQLQNTTNSSSKMLHPIKVYPLFNKEFPMPPNIKGWSQFLSTKVTESLDKKGHKIP